MRKRVTWGGSLGVGIVTFVAARGGASPLVEPTCSARARELQESLERTAQGEWLSIRATETRGEVTGEISFLAPEIPELHRKVRGHSCSEVLDALSFAYQVHLDRWEPENATSKSESERAGGPRAGDSAGKEPIDAPVAPSGWGTEGGMADGEAPQPQTRARPTQWRVALGPTADWSYSPDMALGLALAGHLRLWKQHWLGLTLGYAQTGFLSTASDLFQTDALSVDVAWVGADRVGSSPFHLGLEVGGRLNLMDVAWAGSGVGPSPGLLSSFAALVLLDLSAEITPRLELGMTFGGSAILVKTQTPSEMEGQRNFQQPHVGGLARIGVVASF